ncbi:MAG: GNAT family N-acetyltransferase [Candidatus Moranbacteria bacterium]|nr:GNAT family N-acetyltransferase [Candidatus Moranbacteria bacterium]
MKEIYLENYHNFPEEFRQKIIESLDKKLANPQAKFYTLYHNGEIVAFNSFTPQEDGTVHFANFNVDPRYNYAKLGEAMMEVSLDKEAQENSIVAEAVEGLPISETYINKKGFQKTGEIELAGVKLINIKKRKI